MLSCEYKNIESNGHEARRNLFAQCVYTNLLIDTPVKGNEV